VKVKTDMIRKYFQGILKILFLILLLQLFLFHVAVIGSSFETVVKVEPRISFGHINETFRVNVTVSNVQNLYGVEVTLFWNTSILELLNASHMLGVEAHPDGVLYGLSDEEISPYKDEVSQEQGRYILAGSSVAPAPSFNGSGNIVMLTFRVIGTGTCELEIESKLASDIMTQSGVKPIEHTTINGFFGPILITAIPNTITIGESVTLSGFVAVAQANVSVAILNKHDEETDWSILETLKTDEKGSYLYTWKPEKCGKYHLKSTATVLGSEETSPVISVYVNEQEQPPWLYYILATVVVVVIMIAMTLVYRKRMYTRRKTKHP